MREHELTLQEAGGIFKRSPADPPFTAVAGNKFGAKPGEEFTFVDVVSYPTVGAFKTPEQRDQAVAKVSKGHTVVTTNVPTKNLLGFAIATFESEQGQIVKFLRYFADIKPSMLWRWRNNELPGLQSELQGSRKRRSGLMVKDLMAGKSEFENNVELMSYLQGSALIGPNIKSGLAMIAQGRMPVFKDSADDFAAIRDNLGEIIQALCLSYGLVGGDADLARVNIFTDYDTRWDQLALEFPISSTQGLVDFYLKSGSSKLGVSAKGGRGASGSISNLNSAAKLLSPTELKNFKKRFPDAARLLEFNDTYSAKELPLQLAKVYGIENIKDSNIKRILSLISTNETDSTKLNAWEQRQVKAYNASPSGSWNYGYWILAKIAKDVIQEFNSSSNNSDAFKYLLNKTSMMQCYTKAVIKDDSSVVITGIDSRFPMVFKGTIQLVSDKSYYSSMVSGSFTFRMSQ